MEVIKDLQDELDSLCAQYADIADKESTTTLLARISAIHDEIVAVSAQITALGDISTLRSNVTTNTNNITTLDNRTNGLTDYVIESQLPTSQNNSTWYRKYKSGWVEQGGVISGRQGTVTLPIQMNSSSYTISHIPYVTSTPSTAGIPPYVTNITKTEFTIYNNNGDAVLWLVNGQSE